MSEPSVQGGRGVGEARGRGAVGQGSVAASEPLVQGTHPPARESVTDAGAAGDRRVGVRLAPDSAVPQWLRPLVDRAVGARLPPWVRHATVAVPTGARRSAVLMLLGDGPSGPDLLLTGRAASLRAHAGQPAFPGGALEPGEDAVAAALREGHEETGLDPLSVTPAAVLPELYLQPSRFAVRPVLAHWRHPGPVAVVDPAETAVVARVPVTELADPANRGTVRPRAGIESPAFTVAGLVVWGFTAGLVDLLLQWGGWSRPWDRDRLIEMSLPAAVPRIDAGSAPPAGRVAR